MTDELSKRRLRAWLRLLRVTRGTENHLREFLRVNHATTLPRFDVMAALHRAGGPMKMSALSRQLLVSNGNATRPRSCRAWNRKGWPNAAAARMMAAS